ncbi:FAD-binding oxidoreductase [Aquipuribacter sp. MA13-6]|uniref:FAD-binding oxidoreductase n=1 Tax=unclassified Aquipuribacter TaxID=2635084 RepID=UPI003EEC4FF8
MRRWNGWGDDTRGEPVPRPLSNLLASTLGAGRAPADVSLADVVAHVPPSRLAGAGCGAVDPEDRVRHARGQSFPDLVALRSGRLGAAPDAVARPRSPAEVRELLHRAGTLDAVVVPYGGGTSVVGGVTAPRGERPVLTVDTSRLGALVALDRRAQLATLGAGTRGPRVEASLRACGGTLGHFPQSFELSTVGGWVATRSVGQQSVGFGAMDELLVGVHLESPVGPLTVPAVPRSAAGPDLRQLVLGSEGRLGVITDATLRVRPLPEVDEVHAVFLPGWDAALTATRALAQSGTPLSMLRLSTAAETATNLAMAHGPTVGLLQALLSARGVGGDGCLLLVGVTGSTRQVRQRWRTAHRTVRHHGGVHVGRGLGTRWQRGRFRQPYLRDGLWAQGYGVDTVESATGWARVPALVDAVESALRGALGAVGEQVQAVTHLSHVYPTGSSIYTTFVFRLGDDAEQTLHRWRLCKDAASGAVMAAGGTISHQHGVGVDHREHLPAEKGRLGMDLLRAAVATADPDGLLNPGALL